MRFSEWVYRRPDYLAIKRHLKDYTKRMQNASSYEELRGAWLDAKAEVEYMEYQEGGSKSYLELLDIAHLSNPFLENTVSAVCCPIIEELNGLL